MTIGAGLDGVGKVAQAFADFAAATALPAPVRRSMLVALDELVANAVTHGMVPGGPTVEVTVEGTLEADRLVVTVRDSGPPFDPLAQAAPDTTLDVEDRPIGGLGLHLVRRMMDDVGYARRDDRNEVVLVKRLAAHDGAGAPRENG